MVAVPVSSTEEPPKAPEAPSKVPHSIVRAIPLPMWKRTFDCVAAGIVFALLAPVMACISAVSFVLLDRPILYRQQRGGLGGTRFDIVKFRTMTNEIGADGNLLPDDQRRHPWGNFLRKSSLDELPALLNILRGDMSVVGPRPLMAKYLDRYDADQAKRHCVTPGLTGLAQTRGRNVLGWEERFELDLQYVETRSFRTDVRILIDTVRIVLTREGADGNDHCTEFQGSLAANERAPIAPRS